MSYLQMRERIIAALTGHPFHQRKEPHVAEIAMLIDRGEIRVHGAFDVIKCDDPEVQTKLETDQNEHGFIVLTLDGRRIDPKLLPEAQSEDMLRRIRHKVGTSIHDLFGAGNGVVSGLGVECCECHGIFMVGQQWLITKMGASIWDIKNTREVTCPYCGHKAHTYTERNFLTDTRPSHPD